MTFATVVLVCIFGPTRHSGLFDSLSEIFFFFFFYLGAIILNECRHGTGLLIRDWQHLADLAYGLCVCLTFVLNLIFFELAQI